MLGVVLTLLQGASPLLLIFLSSSASCQASPWTPPSYDALESDVLVSEVETTLASLEKAIDQRNNPVLANLTRTWGSLCMKEHANSILARSWPQEHPLQLEDRLAPWSVATEVLRYAREVKDVTSSQFHQHCESSPAALLQSVGRGERICTLRLFTPRQTCTILNKYSQIFWLGNSLTRQTLIGLLNLLSSNLQHIHKYTSNPRFPQFEEQAKEAELMCQCDGQFSVHSSCTSSYRLMALQEGIINVCSDIMGESFWKKSFQFEYYQPADMNRMHLSRCRDSETMNDIRPIVMYFEGGNIDPSAAPNKNSRHLDKYKHPRDFNIQAYFKRTLSSFITSYEKFYQFCPNGKSIPLHIIFSGVNAQSVHPQDRNGYKYKRADGSRLGADGGSSSDADLIDLNGRLFKYLQKWHPQVHLVNFLNLTVLPTDTADGYHYLTATNIQKATTLLRLMDMI